MSRKVQFLGHIILQNGISPDPEKTSKVLHWPVPTTALEVQQFLGLANYYRRFVRDFAAKAKPLHRLTEKRLPFKWTAECQKSFNDLNRCLTSAPTLTMPSWSKPFIIDTDASDTGIGAVLSQVDENGFEHVTLVEYPLKPSETTRKELLALVAFLQHFRQYLLGRSFTVRTDHGALAWLRNFRNPEDQLARWLENCKSISLPSFIAQAGNTLMQMLCQGCRADNVAEIHILVMYR